MIDRKDVVPENSASEFDYARSIDVRIVLDISIACFVASIICSWAALGRLLENSLSDFIAFFLAAIVFLIATRPRSFYAMKWSDHYVFRRHVDIWFPRLRDRHWLAIGYANISSLTYKHTGDPAGAIEIASSLPDEPSIQISLWRLDSYEVRALLQHIMDVRPDLNISDDIVEFAINGARL